MIDNKFDGVWVRAVVTDEVTGSEMVWFSGRDVSRLLGRRIKKHDMTRAGMVEGKDFATVMVTDEVYFDLQTEEERKILREWRQQDKVWELMPHLRPNSHSEQPEVWELIPQMGTNSHSKQTPRLDPRSRSPFKGTQRRLLISEAGFYRLIFTSRGMFAERMKRWLADEVIPSIRRYGSYQIPEDHAIWEVFGEMEDELSMYRYVVESPQSKVTVADLIAHDFIAVNRDGKVIKSPSKRKAA